jgi:hypothetical protein
VQDPDTPKRVPEPSLAPPAALPMRVERREIQAFVAAMILSGGIFACSDNSSRAEARALLERISAVDLRAPFEKRASQVQALSTLPLATAELVAVRDACSKAHGGLLAAERAQAAARVELDRLAAAAQRDQAELAAVGAQLSAAASQLQAAQAALPTCEARAQELALHKR